MVKLYTDDGLLDMYPDEGIILKEKILNDTGINGGISTFTKDFTIPASPNNNLLLGHYDNKDVVSTINPNQAISAKINIDEEFDIKGKIELLSVTKKYGKATDYSIVFYSSVTNFRTIIGDTLLEDVSEFDTQFGFTWTDDATITDTWDNYYSTFIPIISWNRWLKWYDSGTGDDDIATFATGVRMTELRVGLNFIEFIEAIGTEFGITLEFDKVTESLFTRLYIIPSLVADISASYNIEDYKTDVETSSVITITTTRSIINMATVNSDPHSNWASNTLYTAEFTGDYVLRFTLTNSTVEKREITVVNTAGPIDITSAVIGGAAADIYITTTLTATHTYRFEIASIVGSGTHTADMRFRTYTVPFNLIGEDYSAQSQMPNMRVIDFLSGFLRSFNLMIIETDTDVYTITDFDNLYSSDVLDLNTYIDASNLVYKKVGVYDEIDYKHKEGKDAPNVAFKEVTGREYGQLLYRPDVDFSDGKKQVESIFNIFPPAYMDVYDGSDKIGTTDMRHHFQLSNDTPPKPVLANFMLLYHNLEQDTEFTWYLQDGVDGSGDPTFAAQTTYPAYSAVREYESDSDTYTVSYEEENVFVGVIAEGTIFNTFSLDWISNKYNSNTYSLDVTFKASYAVYLQITDYVKIYYDGIEHLIDEYSYDTAKKEITLKLIRYDN